MKEDQGHHRRSIRLHGYDYSSEGGYFITLVTHARVHLFGEVNEGEMDLNDYGKVVRDEWFNTRSIRDNIELIEDEFVVMPNHIHGIIWIIDQPKNLINPLLTNQINVGVYRDRPLQSPSNNLGAIVRGFKSSVTTQINTRRGVKGVPVWQRNYYEHIIGTAKDYENIAEYIFNNPRYWDDDTENNPYL